MGSTRVRWDKACTEPAEYYTFLHRNGNGYHQFSFFSAVRGVFVSNQTLSIILRSYSGVIPLLRICMFLIYVKTNDKKDSFYEELEQIFKELHNHHNKKLLCNFNTKP
jgi:hypothetical protein